MGDISEHFNRSEFECKCGCGFNTVDVELVKVLELLRAELRASAVYINSGNRCVSHNMLIGGAANSTHTEGKAADIDVMGVDPDMVADYLEERYPNRYGIGRYKGRTHIDVRKQKARWDNR